MRHLAILLLVSALSVAATAQGTRPSSSGDVKRNSRSVTPTPTPEPTIDNSADHGEVIRVNTQLVSLPVRVMDKDGRFVGGLKREDFKVFENGSEQQIELFSNEEQPFVVALVLDMSYSTTFKVAEIQNAAIAFIEQLRPNDKVMVVSFDQEVHLHCEPTSDRNEIYRAIKSTKIGTGTSLYEAMDLIMNQRFRDLDARKAIILFTDGVDTTSRRSNDLRNLSDAMELDSLIYTIRYDTFADVQRMKRGVPAVAGPPPITVPVLEQNRSPFPTVPAMGMPGSQGTTPEEYERARNYLDQLVARTGGRLYEASTTGNLATAFSKIASELREFYSIGYYPREERSEGQRAQLKVKVEKPGLVVRARELRVGRKRSG
jgi:Ca-activated chloride channel homolog